MSLEILNEGMPVVLENSLKCTITFATFFRHMPLTGLGIIPLAVVFAWPVHTNATLFLVQTLLIIPTCFVSIDMELLLQQKQQTEKEETTTPPPEID